MVFVLRLGHFVVLIIMTLSSVAMCHWQSQIRWVPRVLISLGTSSFLVWILTWLVCNSQISMANKFEFEFNSPSKLPKLRSPFNVEDSDDSENLRTPPKLMKFNNFGDLQTPDAPRKKLPRTRRIPVVPAIPLLMNWRMSPEQRDEGCVKIQVLGRDSFEGSAFFGSFSFNKALCNSSLQYFEIEHCKFLENRLGFYLLCMRSNQ